MGNLWLKIWIWTKITVISVLVIYALLFVYNNLEQPIQLWVWFGSRFGTSMLVLMLLSFLLGVVVVLLGRTVFRTVGQIRHLHQRKLAQQQEREAGRAAMLQTRPEERSKDQQ